MGFLDKLVKKGVDSLIENVANTVTDAVNNAMGSTHTNNGTGNVNQGTYKEPVQRNVTSGEYREKPVAQKMTNEKPAEKPYVSHPYDEKPLDERITYVLQNDYPQYEIGQKISAGAFGAPEQARDYDFVLYENGQPKLTIIMLDDRNHYKLRAVRLAHEASEQAGVPCMNIMTYLPSTVAYIQQIVAEKLA